MPIPLYKSSSQLAFLFFKLTLLCIYLKSIYAWFSLNWTDSIVLLSIAIIGIVFLIYNLDILSIRFSKSIYIDENKLILIIIYFLAKFIFTLRGNLFGYLGVFLSTFIVALIILMDNKTKIELFEFFSKAFALITLVSLFFWVLFLIGIQLPFTEMSFNGRYEGYNYYTFFYNPDAIRQFIQFNQHHNIYRFSSIFLEPGHYNLVAPLIIFVYKFNLRKKRVVIILLGVLFSFSLAGYILIFITAIMQPMFRYRNPIKFLLTYFVIGCASILIYSKISGNNEFNIVNQAILSRLEFNKDKGAISGYNRSTSESDKYFFKIIESNQRYLGVGQAKYDKLSASLGNNSGYKFIIIRTGIIGFSLMLLIYIFITMQSKNKRVYGFFFIWFLSFLQSGSPLREAILFTFITGAVYLKTHESPINNTISNAQ